MSHSDVNQPPHPEDPGILDVLPVQASTRGRKRRKPPSIEQQFTKEYDWEQVGDSVRPISKHFHFPDEGPNNRYIKKQLNKSNVSCKHFLFIFIIFINIK